MLEIRTHDLLPPSSNSTSLTPAAAIATIGAQFRSPPPRAAGRNAVAGARAPMRCFSATARPLASCPRRTAAQQPPP